MGNIIWLASYQKEGNTWLRAFLHHLFVDADKPLPLTRTRGGEVSASASSLHWYQAIDPRPPLSWDPATIARMRPAVQKAIAASRQGSVFCKTHMPLMMIHGVPTIEMAMTAGALYIVRDPRDIALSFADFHGIGVDAAIASLATPNLEVPAGERQVAEPMGSWSQHVESWTGRPSPAIHVVRYEDLHGEPERAFGAIAAFLRLNATKERIARAIAHTSFATMRAQEERDGFDERSPAQERHFRKGVAGGWREALTSQQARRIEADHGEQMRRYGYLPAEAAP